MDPKVHMDLDDIYSKSSCLPYVQFQPFARPLPNNMCPEYLDKIVNVLRDSEKKHRPLKTYLEEKQRDVTQQMRAILIDWLNEVTEEFSLKKETLCIAVNYADRYLSKVLVPRNRLQLVGVSSMLIASKMEEIIPPTIDDFVYITDNTYTRDEVIKMELAILNELRYELTAVTMRDFVGIYLRMAPADKLVCMLTDYFVELTLQEYMFLRWAPSMVAASAVVLALFTAEAQCWSETLAYYTQYQPHELNDCIREMHRCFKNAAQNSLQAVREKYSHSRYLRVSTHTQPPPHAPSF